ncbi:hypothetical protein G3I76_28335, partial [Streptomyces sp. SID11233]|nr:hypothetical protein [Streptomyces sp. SID11233]
VPSLADPATRDDLGNALSLLLREHPGHAREWLAAMGAIPRLRTAAGDASWPPVPLAPHDFQNRKNVLRQLDHEARRAYQGAPRAVQLCGPPGIGTSATALHWMALGEGAFG